MMTFTGLQTGLLIIQEGTSETEIINTMLDDQKLRNVAKTGGHGETRSRQEICILSEAGAISLIDPGQVLSPAMASVSSSAQGQAWVG